MHTWLDFDDYDEQEFQPVAVAARAGAQKWCRSSAKMARFVQIILLLLACVTEAFLVPRAPSALRMRSRITATPAEGEEVQPSLGKSDTKAGFVFRGDDKVNTRRTMATPTVPDDCDAVDSRPEVRMHSFTDSVRVLRSPKFIAVPTVRNRR